MEKQINFDYFEIEYSDRDILYIQLVVQEYKSKYIDIMKFFNLEKLDGKVLIKFWDNLSEYRDFFNERLKKYDKKVEEYETARSTINPMECRIDLLCLDERKKCKGHQNDTLEKLLKVCIHEFVHICHFAYKGNNGTMTWFAEALATTLSNQYEDLSIDCSLEDIIKGKAHYINYYSMGRYLIDNCDKEYILELAKNKELLENDTSVIYYKALEYVAKDKKL